MIKPQANQVSQILAELRKSGYIYKRIKVLNKFKETYHTNYLITRKRWRGFCIASVINKHTQLNGIIQYIENHVKLLRDKL